MKDELLTMKQAADYLGVCDKTIRMYIKGGLLKVAKKYNCKFFLFSVTDLDNVTRPKLGRKKKEKTASN